MALKQRDIAHALDYICDTALSKDFSSVVEINPKGAYASIKVYNGRRWQDAIIVMPNNMSKNEFNGMVVSEKADGIAVLPVFYKDGKTAFKRYKDHTQAVRMRQGALKNYDPKQIQSMISLRDVENLALDNFGPNLTYFQPETLRLAESVREFNPERVEADYTHLSGKEYLRIGVNRKILEREVLMHEVGTFRDDMALELFADLRADIIGADTLAAIIDHRRERPELPGNIQNLMHLRGISDSTAALELFNEHNNSH